MKRIVALMLAGVILFAGCGGEVAESLAGDDDPAVPTYELEQIDLEPETPDENERTGAEPGEGNSDPTDEPDDPEPEIIPEPDPEPPARLTVDEYYLQCANEIAEAFINKDTERLSFHFADDSGRAFDFVKELDFIEFELISLDLEVIERDGERWTSEWVFYFNITVKNGTDDIFTLGGREWELRLRSEERSVVLQFSPKGTVINRLWNSTWSDYAMICYGLSNDLEVFETMSDFNLLIYNFGDDEVYNEFGFINWDSYTYRVAILINRIQRIFGNEERPRHLPTADEVAAQAEYIFGITNLNYSALEIFLVRGFGHGWFWRYPVLVSEEITDSGATIVIDYYGDTGHLFVARSMKYNLEFGKQGVRIVSTELLYSNDDLIVARGII
jgi:hypothetical protein